ncbi:MAG: membrane protein insertion efficiency factor YidD [Candidatus Omnitrophota bacterium]
MLSQIVIKLIRGYQLFWRNLRLRSCRFTPSCSDYAMQAITQYGLLRGSLKAGMRILSCHPFSGRSGYDPVE